MNRKRGFETVDSVLFLYKDCDAFNEIKFQQNAICNANRVVTCGRYFKESRILKWLNFTEVFNQIYCTKHGLFFSINNFKIQFKTHVSRNEFSFGTRSVQSFPHINPTQIIIFRVLPNIVCTIINSHGTVLGVITSPLLPAYFSRPKH